MRRLASLLCFTVLSSFLAACAALDPYDNQVYCRAVDQPGQCMDVVQAYRQAVIDSKTKTYPTEEPDPVVPQGKGAPSGAPGFNPTDPTRPAGFSMPADISPRDAYLRARDARLAELLEEPVVPILAPPRLLRVLILPYTTRTAGVEELHMARYTYIKLEDTRFVLDTVDHSPQRAADPFERTQEPTPVAATNE